MDGVFYIINHGATKIHTYTPLCLLHFPRIKFLRTEFLGSTSHISRYLIHKVHQGGYIKSASTSTRAFFALYFCPNNVCAMEHGAWTCLCGYVWRPEVDLGVPFAIAPHPILSLDRVSHWRWGLRFHLGQAGGPASPGVLPYPVIAGVADACHHDQLLMWMFKIWTQVLILI